MRFNQTKQDILDLPLGHVFCIAESSDKVSNLYIKINNVSANCIKVKTLAFEYVPPSFQLMMLYDYKVYHVYEKEDVDNIIKHLSNTYTNFLPVVDDK